MFVLFSMSALVHHNYISASAFPRLDQHLVLSIQQPLYLSIPPSLKILTVHGCCKTHCYYYHNIMCL